MPLQRQESDVASISGLVETPKTTENTSNISGVHDSRNKIMDKFLDEPRNTTQALVLIMYPKNVNQANKFRSTIVKNTGVMKAYGKGEFLGQAVENSFQIQFGEWNPNLGLGFLAFDTTDDANKFLNTQTEVRDWLWLGGVETYIIPCCNPCRSFFGNEICSIEFHDVKSGEEFTRELQLLKKTLESTSGFLVSATSNVNHVRGIRRPGFVVITQWKNMGDFNAFNKGSTFRTGSCGSRIVIEIEPFSNT